MYPEREKNLNDMKSGWSNTLRQVTHFFLSISGAMEGRHPATRSIPSGTFPCLKKATGHSTTSRCVISWQPNRCFLAGSVFRYMQWDQVTEAALPRLQLVSILNFPVMWGYQHQTGVYSTPLYSRAMQEIWFGSPLLLSQARTLQKYPRAPSGYSMQ